MRTGRTAAASEQGLASTEVLAVSGIALLVVLAAANLVVAAHLSAVLDAAAAHAARQTARVDADVRDCPQVASARVAMLAPGPLHQRAGTPVCRVDDDVVHVEIPGAAPSWVPGVPELVVRGEAVAAREVWP